METDLQKNAINDTEREQCSNNPTYREEDENDHQSAHWDSAGLLILVLCEEKEGCHANLLHIQPHKNVLDGLGEE